jgi:hypothetical protein
VQWQALMAEVLHEQLLAPSLMTCFTATMSSLDCHLRRWLSPSHNRQLPQHYANCFWLWHFLILQLLSTNLKAMLSYTPWSLVDKLFFILPCNAWWCVWNSPKGWLLHHQTVSLKRLTICLQQDGENLYLTYG